VGEFVRPRTDHEHTVVWKVGFNSKVRDRRITDLPDRRDPVGLSRLLKRNHRNTTGEEGLGKKDPGIKPSADRVSAPKSRQGVPGWTGVESDDQIVRFVEKEKKGIGLSNYNPQIAQTSHICSFGRKMVWFSRTDHNSWVDWRTGGGGLGKAIRYQECSIHQSREHQRGGTSAIM